MNPYSTLVPAAGFAEVILYFNVGMKPHQQVKEEMDRFMRQVATNFEGKHSAVMSVGSSAYLQFFESQFYLRNPIAN